jgi:hypothetical protein
VASQQECTGTFMDADGQLVQREWLNSSINFDNIFQAFIALFATVSLDGALLQEWCFEGALMNTFS